MSLSEQNGVCKAEATTVRDHITAGHANFASILSERMASMDAADKQE